MASQWGVDDIKAISELAKRVNTDYEALSDYKHIAQKVKALQTRIDHASQYFGGTALKEDDQHEGQEVLKGCHGVLENLSHLVEKYNRLHSTNPNLAFKRVKYNEDGIATLSKRLASNTKLLNKFIQRFDISTIII